jgi:hypothetical protein
MDRRSNEGPYEGMYPFLPSSKFILLSTTFYRSTSQQSMAMFQERLSSASPLLWAVATLSIKILSLPRTLLAFESSLLITIAFDVFLLWQVFAKAYHSPDNML